MIRVFSQYVSSKSVLLMILEGALILAALACGIKLRFWNDPAEMENFIHFPNLAFQALMMMITFQVCFYYSDLYNLSSVRGRNEQLICLAQSLGAGCLVLGMLYYLFPALVIGRGIFFISLALVAAFVCITRVALDHAWRVAGVKQRILIVGTGEMATTVGRELTRRDDLNFELLGYAAPANSNGHQNSLSNYPVIGTTDHLESLALQHQVSRIIVALEDRRGALPIQDLVRLRMQGVRVEDAHTAMAALGGRVWLASIQPSWFVFSDGFHRSRTTLALKRMFDLATALVGFIVSFPVMLLVALAVRLDSPGAVIYRQTRVGLAGKCFEVLKFRSMRADAELSNGAQWASVDDPRITRLGRYLRKFRLDELPQFVNVIRGEMSFVGPRPERPIFVDQLRQQISYYDERHSVRPGLTGWAQVQYPYGATVEDAFRKLEYDLFYLKNMSVFFDSAIILQTIRIVLTGQGGR